MSDWIGVVPNAPTIGQEVLMYTDTGQRIVGHLEADGMWVSGNVYVSWDYVHNHDVGITHWMPLPNGPE